MDGSTSTDDVALSVGRTLRVIGDQYYFSHRHGAGLLSPMSSISPVYHGDLHGSTTVKHFGEHLQSMSVAIHSIAAGLLSRYQQYSFGRGTDLKPPVSDDVTNSRSRFSDRRRWNGRHALPSTSWTYYVVLAISSSKLVSRLKFVLISTMNNISTTENRTGSAASVLQDVFLLRQQIDIVFIMSLLLLHYAPLGRKLMSGTGWSPRLILLAVRHLTGPCVQIGYN